MKFNNCHFVHFGYYWPEPLVVVVVELMGGKDLCLLITSIRQLLWPEWKVSPRGSRLNTWFQGAVFGRLWKALQEGIGHSGWALKFISQLHFLSALCFLTEDIMWLRHHAFPSRWTISLLCIPREGLCCVCWGIPLWSAAFTTDRYLPRSYLNTRRKLAKLSAHFWWLSLCGWLCVLSRTLEIPEWAQASL